MTWVQYRDADHKLSERFGIQCDSALLHDRFGWRADGGDDGAGLGRGGQAEEADCEGEEAKARASRQ